MSDRKSAPNRLRELRERRGWSQERLGEKVGLRMATVSRHEGGSRKMSRSQVEDYARALGVSTVEIFIEPANLVHLSHETVELAV